MIQTAGSRDTVSRSGATHSPDAVLFDELDRTFTFYGYAPDALIQVLHRAQELFGYLREDVVDRIATALRLPLSQVHGVIGFYSYFSRKPLGKHVVNICLGTACYVRGADLILRRLEKELGIMAGQTTPDGQFSLRCARCVGACGMAPVVMIGPDIHSQLRPDRLKGTLRKYR